MSRIVAYVMHVLQTLRWRLKERVQGGCSVVEAMRVDDYFALNK